jgi:alpha-L-arabinofuranosidase
MFFGFNINWFGFQSSYWDNKNKIIVNSITTSLKDDFKGAIYRYPGGSVANRFDWEKSIGPVDDRPKQKPVNWHKPVVSFFGFQEFLDFVNSIDGIPWVVNNLYGDYEKEDQIGLLTNKAKKWANYSIIQKQNIERWEIGNELDRGKYQWSAEKYSNRAKIMGEAIKTIDPNAKFVSMLRDFDVEGHGSANKYNRQLAKKSLSFTTEFALHQYYDGPSITNRLKHICSSINEIKKETEKDISIWITEHARWPRAKNKPINWNSEKYQTYNLQSAISVADYIIAVSGLPEVKSAFYHSLSSTDSPWTLFHKVDNSIRRSIVYRSLQILRKNMLSEVLGLDIRSKNNSNYYGGYDIRASVQTNREKTKYNIWLVNRSNSEAKITFKIPQLSSQKKKAVMLSLFDSNLNRNNMNKRGELFPVSSTLDLMFGQSGEVNIKTPGQSVSTILIQ